MDVTWTEAEREAVLREYGVLDTPSEPMFDNTLRMVAACLGTPMGAINLLTEGRQWLKSEIGFGVRELPRAGSICEHTLHSAHALVVPDLAADPRFEHNPRVAGMPGIRFYAGEVLRSPAGIPLGILCLMDTVARPAGLTACQSFMLKTVAQQIVSLLEAKRAPAERDKALADLQLSKTFQHQILDSADDYAIVSSDMQGVITSWNIGARNILGSSEAEILGCPVETFFTPEDNLEQRARMEMRIALDTGSSIDERWHLRNDGRRFWASGKMSLLRSRDGVVRGFVKVLRDQTERLDERVTSRMAERDGVWCTSPNLLAVIFPNGELLSVNPAFTKILGYVSHELMGRPFMMLAHPEDVHAGARLLRQSILGTSTEMRSRWRHRDGSYRWLAWTAVHDAGIVYATGRDVTVEQAKEEACVARKIRSDRPRKWKPWVS